MHSHNLENGNPHRGLKPCPARRIPVQPHVLNLENGNPHRGLKPSDWPGRQKNPPYNLENGNPHRGLKPKALCPRTLPGTDI